MQDVMQQTIQRGWILAGLFGALVFLIVGGPQLLDVTNVAWIYNEDDIAAVQTGWTYYRNAPWSWPIAANPTYGMDFSGSILFSDAVPLVAIPMKALSPLLPETFQYLGLWVFLSFVLQGVFGWLIMSKFTENPLLRIAGAMIFSLTPIYAYRLTSCTHMSLTAHWLVLASLYLCLPPHTRRPWLWWGLLLAASAHVHVYIFAMVAGLWLADIARRAIVNFRGAWMELAGVPLTVGAAIWLTGVWTGPAAVSQGGFNWFKMNVFALIDPNAWIDSSWGAWSYIMPDIPNWGGDYEGFAYLGLGGIILMGIAIWCAVKVLKGYDYKQALPYAPLIVSLIGMAGFAVSQNVSFGETTFWLWWPEPLQKIGELFRSTGRFIWPLYYVLFIAALYFVTRHFSVRTALAVLLGMGLVQAIDTAPGWGKDRAYLQHVGGAPQTKLTSQFWAEAARRYSGVRLAPHDNNLPGHLDVSFMAFAHGMVTDAVYLSRTSDVGTKASRARIAHGVETGEWPQDTLFVITDEALAHEIAQQLNTSNNFLGRVDGVLVLAPGWTGCEACGAAAWSPAP